MRAQERCQSVIVEQVPVVAHQRHETALFKLFRQTIFRTEAQLFRQPFNFRDAAAEHRRQPVNAHQPVIPKHKTVGPCREPLKGQWRLYA